MALSPRPLVVAHRGVRRGFTLIEIIVVIAIVSAIPILRHTWWMAEDISTHGAPIDEQMSETMAEAGISFLASQIILAYFIWRFSGSRPGEKVKHFPGGAKAMVWAAFLLVGTEVLALGIFGVKAAC